MIASITGGGNGARIAQRAWVDTLAVVACLVVGTLRIRFAAELEAAVLRVPGVAWFACAHWEVIRDVTVSIFAAIARADASVVDT